MNLVTGELAEIFVEEGTTIGKVQVHGASFRVPLTFLPNARVGDMILIESGVAISTVSAQPKEEE